MPGIKLFFVPLFQVGNRKTDDRIVVEHERPGASRGPQLNIVRQSVATNDSTVCHREHPAARVTIRLVEHRELMEVEPGDSGLLSQSAARRHRQRLALMNEGAWQAISVT